MAATAESLPFEDQSFDAAMAFATIDHWQDPIAGLREMRRVARRVVVFTKDFSDPDLFWQSRRGRAWRAPAYRLNPASPRLATPHAFTLRHLGIGSAAWRCDLFKLR